MGHSGWIFLVMNSIHRNSVYIAADSVPISVLILTKQVMEKESVVAVEHMHLLLLLLCRDGVPCWVGIRPHESTGPGSFTIGCPHLVCNTSQIIENGQNTPQDELPALRTLILSF